MRLVDLLGDKCARYFLPDDHLVEWEAFGFVIQAYGKAGTDFAAHSCIISTYRIGDTVG